MRRAYLDALGAMPRGAEARVFLADVNPGKRAALVARLLAREEVIDYLSLKWGDVKIPAGVTAEIEIILSPRPADRYETVTIDLSYLPVILVEVVRP